jgi:putative ABC transport system permease protein
MTGLVVIVLISLPFLFVLARRPILRRLALRNAVRRPREAMLVVLGSLLGAAIITGSLVVGDTINASIKQIAHAHLGPIDELVIARGPADRDQLLNALHRIGRKKVDGVLPLATLDAAATSTGPHVLSAPHSQVIGVDFAAARTFGLDEQATGMSGPTPASGHAAITVDLARTLSIGTGDTIAVYAYGERTQLVVDRVLPRRGVAGFWLGWQQDARNVLVSQATFDRIETATGSGAPAQWYVAVSNTGGVESGARFTESVTKAIRSVTPAAPFSPQIIASKQLALDQAQASGKAFTEMFTAMGSFGVLAGLLLLVNLFVMLAAERKTEMGMARAVGLSRADLVRAFSTEGWLYALVATTLGMVAGVGLGRAIVAFCQRIFSSTHNRLDLMFTVTPSSLATGFAIALVISTTTIVVMSVRVSRLNIIRAIRDIPEPARPRARGRWLLAGGLAVAVGAAWTMQAFPSHNAFGELLGPILVVLGSAPYLGRAIATRHVNSVLALLVVGWGLTALALDAQATEGASIMLYVAQGVTLTAAAVTFVSFQQERLNTLLRWLTGGRSLALRLGLAYPLARRSRTAMTVAMYALVIFILVFITTLASMIDAQVATATARVQGGYALVVSSSPANPIPLHVIASLDGVRSVAPLATTIADFKAGSMTKALPWNLTAFDKRFLRGGPPKLEDRGAYPTDLAAWKAVLNDDSLTIIDPAFLQSGGGPARFVAKPGSTIRVTDPYSGKTRTLTVAALAPSDYLIQNGAFYSAEGARTLFGWRLVSSRYYVALRRGVDADRFAQDVQSTFVRNGAEATSIRSLMDEGFTMTRQIFQLFQGYLGMGLIVGIAGIAVVMIRAVRERRRQIGSLRAIGFSSRTIGRSFAIESSLVAIEGTLIGALLALVTLYNIVTLSDAFGKTTFAVPAVSLALLLLGTVLATLLATIWPALAASRTRPAVALRITD